MGRFTLNGLALLSLVVFAAIMTLWMWSFSLPALSTDPSTGFSSVAPPHPVPIPIASDAQEYLVLMRGNLERWEYAWWERKWYRLNGGISKVDQWLPVALLFVAPGLWLMTRHRLVA